MFHLGEDVMAKVIAPAQMATIVQATQAQTPMTTPVIPGGPMWLTPKNALVGGGVLVGLYAAYLLLIPPKKKAAPVAGLGWLFGKHRRRRRR